MTQPTGNPSGPWWPSTTDPQPADEPTTRARWQRSTVDHLPPLTLTAGAVGIARDGAR